MEASFDFYIERDLMLCMDKGDYSIYQNFVKIFSISPPRADSHPVPAVTCLGRAPQVLSDQPAGWPGERSPPSLPCLT
jgi:hypothetical protein